MGKPTIRFEGYTDDWEQRKLGEVCEIKDSARIPNSEWSETGVPYIRASDVTNENTDGVLFISQERYEFYKNRTGVPTKDDVLFNGGGEIGKSLLITDKKPIYVQGGAVLYARTSKSRELVGQYLKTYFETTNAKSYVDTASAGGTMRHFTLKPSQMMRILMPSVEEQEKIGEYFANLDHLITLHHRKCEETKKLKKFMLQKMFPKKGEKVPDIRFDGFTDDWEQRKFSDCYKMSSGYAFKMSDYCDEGVGLINGESIQHGIINDDNLNHLPESFVQHYPEFLLKENDIVVGLNRPITNGNLKIARIPSKYNDSLLYQRAGKIVYKTDCDKDFTYVLLSQEILKHTLVEAVGSDQPFISTSKLDGWKMMMPSDMEEQVKIGEYFQNLDHLITLHQHKCEELQNIKKFMLQNMFT